MRRPGEPTRPTDRYTSHTLGKRARCAPLLACALALAAACGEKPAAVAQKTEPTAVALTRVVQSQLADELDVNGTLSAEDSVVVAAKVPGRVAEMRVDLGSAVEKGALLVQIEATDYSLQVRQAEALVLGARAALGLGPADQSDTLDAEKLPEVQAARATRDETASALTRVQQLVAKKMVGTADLDTASAAAARAEAGLGVARQDVWSRVATLKQRRSALAIAQQALNDTSVRAPISGSVRERNTTLGALVAVGTPLVSIVRVDPLRLRVTVPEHAAGEVSVGQPIRVLDERGEVRAVGTIARLAPILSDDTRTLSAEADIPAAKGLVPGAFVRAAITTRAQRSLLSVPESAVVVFAGLHKVLTIEHGKVRELPIEVGRTFSGRVEVVSGLAEGSAVILHPGSLQNGDAVRAEAEGERAEAR